MTTKSPISPASWPASLRASNDSEWADIVSRACFPLTPARPSPAFAASMRFNDLTQGVRMCDVSTAPISLQRTPHLLKSTPSDDVLLLMHLSGDGQARQEGRHLSIPPGSATLVDPASPYTVGSATAARQVSIMMPRAVLRGLPVAAPELRARLISGNLVSLRALRSLALSVLEADEQLDFEEADSLSSALLELAHVMFSKAIGERTPPAVGERALTTQATEYIHQHLADTELTPERVAAALHISVRQLSNLMSGEESPAAYIRSSRLKAARRDLVSASSRADSIADIGARWGFGDATTFTRAFLRQYGERPSDTRAAAVR